MPKKSLGLSLLGLAFLIAFQNCSGGFTTATEISDMSMSSIGDNSSKSDQEARVIFAAGGGKDISPSFGFFADGMEGVGRGNHLAETAPYANVHFVSGDQPQVIVEKLKQVKALKSKSFLMLQNYIFDWKTVRIRSQASNRLAELKSALVGAGVLDAIVGIYIIDEPYWIDSLSSQPLGFNQVYENLKNAALLVQNVFGQEILILSSEAYPVLDRQISSNNWPGFPEQFDLLAVNCYLAFGNICETEAKYKKYVETLEASLKENQSQFLTLDNYWNLESQVSAAVEARLIERTRYQVSLAQAKGIRLLVSFLYQSQPATVDNLIGLDKMPTLFRYVKEVSSNFRSVSLTPAPVATPTPAPTPTPVPTASPSPPVTPSPTPTSVSAYKSCSSSAFELSCSVDGLQRNLSLVINANVSHGQKTSSYLLPAGYAAERMQVAWTCQNGVWQFTEPNGWCAVKAGVSCGPMVSNLLCSVNGVQKPVAVQVTASATVAGAKTSSYSLPAGLKPQVMAVEWTCQNNQWIFSHPNGWCQLQQP